MNKNVQDIMKVIQENNNCVNYHFSRTSKHDTVQSNKVAQILPTLAYGDAIGNEVMAIHQTLLDNGFNSEIYADRIDDRITSQKVYDSRRLVLSDGDILIYHLSIGSKLDDIFISYTGKKFIIYHNVTPAFYFEKYDKVRAEICDKGIEGVKRLAPYPDACFADSTFNKNELINYGYTCPIEVMPIIIKFEDYKKEPDKGIINRYKDSFNVLFTGRVAPNKKFEDLIQSFYYYKKYFNAKAKLFLVGLYAEEDIYYNKLHQYVNELDLNDDVIFTGHISFEEVLAYFNIADAFLCLSEHEGFCVPLVEAMYFNIPIIAYNSTAIKETLGGSGILLEDKNPLEVAKALYLVESNNELREKIIAEEKERLKAFDDNKIKQEFLSYLKKYGSLE